MRHVFLSYAREDGDILRRVRDTLASESIQTWADDNLTPGTPSWQAAIEQAIEQAGGMVVLLSPDARRSQWVANELSFAAARDVTIFPLLVRGDERDSVPIQLINAQRIDVRSRFLAGMQTLVDTLREHLTSLEEPEMPPNDPAWIDRSRVYIRFWKSLQERSQGRTTLCTNLTALDSYFLATSAGRKGIKISYSIASKWGAVNIYIDTGDKTANKAIFDALYAQKEAIEAEVGEPLDWRRLDNKRSSQITRRIEAGGLDDRDSWPGLQDQMIDMMIRLDRAMRPRLASIVV